MSSPYFDFGGQEIVWSIQNVSKMPDRSPRALSSAAIQPSQLLMFCICGHAI